MKYWGYILLLVTGQIINITNLYSQTDTIKTAKYLAFGFEVIGPIEKLITSNKGNYEINFKPQLSKNLFFVSEAGFLDFSKNQIDVNKSYNYALSGNYFRLGLEYNVFRRNRTSEPNFILIGCRLGHSTTKHQGDNIMISDVVWGNQYYNFPSSKLTSNWFEFTGGIRAQIAKLVALEWQLRLKYLFNKQTSSNMEPYYIAGFGRTNQKFTIGFTYNLYFTLKY